MDFSYSVVPLVANTNSLAMRGVMNWEHGQCAPQLPMVSYISRHGDQSSSMRQGSCVVGHSTRCTISGHTYPYGGGRPRPAFIPHRPLVSRGSPYSSFRLHRVALYNGCGSPRLDTYHTFDDFRTGFSPHPPSPPYGRLRSYIPSYSGDRKNTNAMYRVVVTTGDIEDAGTEAKVYLHIHGTKGKLPKQLLTGKSSSRYKRKWKFKFKRDATQTFNFLKKDIGNLIKIKVEVDGKTKKSGWYLDQIEIIKRIPGTKTEQTWFFSCYNWLSQYKGDCQQTRIIPAKIHTKTEYKILAMTRNIKGAGTDANVFITIFGEIGQTPKLQLHNKDKDRFEAGHKAVFSLRTARVGPMTKVRIEHDNTGERPNWYLERIVVTDVQHPEWKYHFPCNQWLAKGEGDGQISRILLGSFTDYEVVVVTGNLKGAGTDANIFLTMFGHAGQTPKLQLKNNNRDAFDRDHSDTFQLNAACVGPMTKIRIEHDNSGYSPSWFLSRIVVTDLKYPEWKYYFTCNKWLAIDEDDGQTCRDLPGSLDPLVIHTEYEVLVFTGDLEGAGTDANVFLTIFGEAGETEKLQLRNNDKHLFDRDHTDTFVVHSVCIGPMLKCRIEHDNSGASPDWYLERIVITDQKCPKWKYYFPCDQWLAVREADNRTRRLLVGSLNPPPVRTEYHIVVSTGDLKGAGTDARVFITIFGEAGKTPKLPLNNVNKDTFGRKQTDTFSLKAPCVGQMTKIWIEHDGTGSGPDWFLDMVEIADTKHPEWRFYFAYGQWLNKDDSGQPVCRELTASPEPPSVLPQYEVVVYTGDVEDAGTDANVFITIFGGDGQTPQLPLKNNNKNTFDRKQKDTFPLRVTSVGPVSKVRIEHDNSGSDPCWFLQQVVVNEMKQPFSTYAFPCDKWFSLKAGDKQIYRDLYITQPSDPPPEPTVMDEKYVVLVVTGDIDRGGTNANVFITIFGTNEQTRKLPLTNNDRNCFAQKQSATFLLETPGVGPITKIRVEHDNTGLDPDWYLEKIQITESKQPGSFYFHCDKWLSKDRGDKEIFQDLSSTKQPSPDHTQYEVVVFTGDVENGGTDANVFITLCGAKGDTGQFLLKNNNKNTFDRKQRDTFILRALYVGQLIEIRIEHDNTGSAPDWFLDKIEISDLKRPEGKIYHCPCNQWLSQNEGDKLICRKLPVIDSPPQITKYKALVHTGDRKEAGTDANVFLKLYSETGETPELQLRNDQRDTFGRDKIDTFEFEAICLGPLTKIRIKHDDTGSSPGWFLKKTELTDLQHPAHVYTFPCERWLDKNEDDKQICRELPVRLTPDVIYRLEVKTGQQTHAGTSARVSVILYGGTEAEYSSDRLWLGNSTLNRGDLVTFIVRANISLCPLSKIKIGHDQSGSTPRWFLEKVVVSCPSAGLTERFECHEWIPEVDGDQPAEKILKANDPQKVPYTIHVTTGEKENADTSAKVHVILYGGKDAKLSSQKLKLKNGMFHKGGTDTFHVKADINLCPLSKLLIGHDKSGSHPRWYLDRVVVSCPSAPTNAYFECHSWIPDVEGNHINAEKTLVADTPNNKRIVLYNVAIKSPSIYIGNTVTNMRLKIFRDGGDHLTKLVKNVSDVTNELTISPHRKGETDDYSIAKPQKVQLSYEDQKKGSKWFPEMITIKLHSISDSHVFACPMWLNATPERRSRRMHYEIKSWIRDGILASQDAEIKIQIFGQHGKTEKHILTIEGGEQIPSKLEAADAGPLVKLRINHQCRADCAGWLLDKLLVQRVERTTFRPYRQDGDISYDSNRRRHSVSTEFRRRQTTSFCRHHTRSCRQYHDNDDPNSKRRRPRQRQSASAEFRQRQSTPTNRPCCEHHIDRLRYTDDEGNQSSHKSGNHLSDRYSDPDDDTDRGNAKTSNGKTSSVGKRNKYDSEDSEAKTSNRTKTRGTHSKYDSDGDDGADRANRPAPREPGTDYEQYSVYGNDWITESEEETLDEYWFIFAKARSPCVESDKAPVWELLPTDRAGNALDTPIKKLEYVYQRDSGRANVS